MNTTGERIAFRRKQLGLTQEKLEQLSGVSQSQISRYERDDSDLTGTALSALATALQTTTDWLLGRTDDPLPKGQGDLSPKEHEALLAWRHGDRERAATIILTDKKAV